MAEQVQVSPEQNGHANQVEPLSAPNGALLYCATEADVRISEVHADIHAGEGKLNPEEAESSWRRATRIRGILDVAQR